MSREELLIGVNQIFKQAFGKEELVITNDTTAADIEEWDSLMQITLIEMIEDEFDMRFSLDEVTSMANVGAMLDIILQRIN